MNSVPEHLGGHLNKTHTDEGTLKFLKETFHVRRMIDVGCGPGGMQSVAKELEIDWLGIDGDPTFAETPNIHMHDFTKSDFRLYMHNKEIDLAWSVEFLEHVEEQYMNNYMTAFKMCRYAVVTAAPPGYAGHHHVNCRLEDYWIGAFAANGFKYNHKITQEIRKISTMKKPFMQRTGMFFEAYNV